MREKEIIRREIALTFQFLRYLTEHPSEIDKIPNNGEITFLEEEFPQIERPDKNLHQRKAAAYRVNKVFEPVAK